MIEAIDLEDVELLGVAVILTDCYLEPAQYTSGKIIDCFGHEKQIEVTLSNSRPVIPFPRPF